MFQKQIIRIILACMVTIISCKVIIVSQGNDDKWAEFKKKFNKHYEADVDSQRKSVFQQTLEDIITYQAYFNSGIVSFSMGVTYFSDMLEDEFITMALGLDDQVKCENKNLNYAAPKDVSIPDEINWNEKGYVTEVVNQGKCGACWAFSSVASLEGQHKRMTGKLVKLSEQQLVDCSSIAGNKQCHGGQICRAYEYAASTGGITTEDNYPYQEKEQNCSLLNSIKVGSKVTGYLQISSGDEHALKTAVALVGPVAAGMNAKLPSFRNYQSGIYDDSKCGNTSINHAVTIVGYGSEKGKDYWIIKNSWGTYWGEDGFARVIRNKNNLCGLATNALFPVLSENVFGTPVLNGPRAQ